MSPSTSEIESIQPVSRLPLDGKTVVLGVTGSIAAYKAADLASKLVQAGASVDVIMTTAATEFVGVSTFEALTHRPVTTGLWQAHTELSIDHVALALRADCVLIAPATANTVAKLALGIADDPLTATVLATGAPVIVAPAMDADMFASAATQRNIEVLTGDGVLVAGPVSGRLASGLIGKGRLVDNEVLVGLVRQAVGRHGDYEGRRVIVSAGGTRQPIDPIRFISNRSTGKMGYAIAEAARDRGADVLLVTAAGLSDPAGIEVVKASTVDEMRDAIVPSSSDADLLVMAAAISDFTPARVSDQKIKKQDSKKMSLELTRVEDFMPLAHGRRLVKVAFAAETSNVEANARAKVAPKGAAFVVANDVSEPGSGFGTDTNRVTFVDADGGAEVLPLMGKLDVGHAILDRALPLLAER
ncbi:MAG: bifunctional phosphopantothenoylcysteine decarboxylase/phosphopantothenate--cysteine ligase CoaBC [Chloroflexi bacterium]|nr:bifunctional phosphopantothenoylcysteine decarboxylase/phosphopantothenate--cysteine ligase CoaBC [Chloroflexota bacterium]MCH8115752.1 bifunctional phosphopantothenoylcysteine decarboxylase/phosphopantothenate--cysteine ligase CoaBC [Chloroflexota bacterium]MCI0871790.1 bifunctional phosphopantothenoylcysteine decarboxylase/phosphopantothenate--cysteine ligase CoaBC [Chloroflexota bacterium]MCI0874784.1 bifunctional phosphopantothenoylcysteine decarboxylase/phosphopantothenate--cysteine liga